MQVLLSKWDAQPQWVPWLDKGKLKQGQPLELCFHKIPMLVQFFKLLPLALVDHGFFGRYN
jgi:hypothetical protein